MMRMVLPKLKRGKTLPRLGIYVRIDSPDVNLPARIELAPISLPVVYPPFRSVGEVLVWDRIRAYDRYWEPMVPLFGGPGVEGGTEIDFYNPKLAIALFVDGPVHLIPTIAARDHSLRKSVEMLGLKVLSYAYRVPEDIISGFARWYREEVGG